MSVAHCRIETRKGMSVAHCRIETRKGMSVAHCRIETRKGMSVACCRIETRKGMSVACCRIETRKGMSVACCRIQTRKGMSVAHLQDPSEWTAVLTSHCGATMLRPDVYTDTVRLESLARTQETINLLQRPNIPGTSCTRDLRKQHCASSSVLFLVAGSIKARE